MLTMLAEKRNVVEITAPDHVLDAGDLNFRNCHAALRVEEGHAILRRQEKASRGASKEHAIRAWVRRGELLRHFVLEILDENLKR